MDPKMRKTHYTVQLPIEVIDAMDAYCRENSVKKTDFMEAAIRAALKKTGHSMD